MFALMGRSGQCDRWADGSRSCTVPRGGSPTETRSRARWRICVRSCAVRALSRCATTRRSPGKGSARRVRIERRCCTPRDSLICSRETSTGLTQSSARVVEAATEAGVVPFVPVVLAERGMIAIERDDWPEAEAFAERALSIMRSGDFDSYWTSSLVYAWIARVALVRGDIAAGRDYVPRAARLRPLLTYVLPVVSVQALLEMAQRLRRAWRRCWWPRRAQADP